MFGELVVAYLFLGGAGAGGCVVCAVLGLLTDPELLASSLAARFRNECGRALAHFVASPLAVSLGALVVGAACLAVDLGRADRVLLLATSPEFAYVTVGAWALVACIALAALALAAWTGVMPLRRAGMGALNVVLLVAALVTAVYTGLLLSSIPAVPLWHSWWLPVLFVLSALSCGVAIVGASAQLTGAGARFGGVLAGLVRVDAAIVVCEGAVLALWLVSVQQGAAAELTPTDTVALASAKELTAGSLAQLFWGGLVAAGLLAPLALNVFAAVRSRRGGVRLPSGLWIAGGASSAQAEASAHTAQAATRASVRAVAQAAAPPPLVSLATSACVLAGGALLRYLVVAAGALSAVSAFF